MHHAEILISHFREMVGKWPVILHSAYPGTQRSKPHVLITSASKNKTTLWHKESDILVVIVTKY